MRSSAAVCHFFLCKTLLHHEREAESCPAARWEACIHFHHAASLWTAGSTTQGPVALWSLSFYGWTCWIISNILTYYLVFFPPPSFSFESDSVSLLLPFLWFNSPNRHSAGELEKYSDFTERRRFFWKHSLSARSEVKWIMQMRCFGPRLSAEAIREDRTLKTLNASAFQAPPARWNDNTVSLYQSLF